MLATLNNPFSLGTLTPAQLAQAALYDTQAGYVGTTCHTERILCPQCPEGYYTQDVCDSPGFMGAQDASLILNASQSAHPGYGVDLTAQHAYDVAHGAGVGTNDYFNTYGSGTGTVVTQTQTGPTGAAVPSFQQVQSDYDAAMATQSAKAGNDAVKALQTPAGTPNAGSGTAPVTINLSQTPSPGLFGSIPALYLEIGAAVLVGLVALSFLKK